MLFVDKCSICGQIGRSPCGPCAASLSAPPRLPLPEGLDELVALFGYDGAGRRLVASLKYRNQRGSLGWMADRLARRLLVFRAEAVTWVPASHSGQRRRGFDTGEMLARHIAHELRLPVRPFLRRVASDGQSTRTQSERLAGPALQATVGAQRLRISSVILVDDVSTTGASLAAAALVLRECGIRYVFGAVAARTPLHAAA